MNNIKYIDGLIQQYEAKEINTLNNTLVDLKRKKNMILNKEESKKVKTESAPADVIEYFGMQDNTDEEYKNNVAKEYKTLRAKYPDKEMILNGDFGTYLGTEKATPVEKGEYITVYNKVVENKKEEAKFKDKVKAIKKSLKKNDKRLSDETAEKSAEKIAGSMVKKEESKTADMDTVDIIMELEGGELTIADVEDWNAVKSVASDLQNSQGFYGRLLRDMLEAEEEFGGVENLPFPITM